MVGATRRSGEVNESSHFGIVGIDNRPWGSRDGHQLGSKVVDIASYRYPVRMFRRSILFNHLSYCILTNTAIDTIWLCVFMVNNCVKLVSDIDEMKSVVVMVFF